MGGTYSLLRRGKKAKAPRTKEEGEGGGGANQRSMQGGRSRRHNGKGREKIKAAGRKRRSQDAFYVSRGLLGKETGGVKDRGTLWGFTWNCR